MLLKFQARNFKNFKEEVTIDFGKVGGYQFSEDCLNQDSHGNKAVGKMIIYGKNAVGKTNLGGALMDITRHLSPKRLTGVQESGYLNANSEETAAEFSYTFCFEDEILVYRYKKSTEENLCDEELLRNGERCFYYNFTKKRGDFANLKYMDADTLVIDRYLEAMMGGDDDEESTQTLSFLRWVISNTALQSSSVLLKLDDYVRRMAMATSGTRMGPKVATLFSERLAAEGALQQFERFLNDMGVACKLELKQLPDGQNQLYFAHGSLIPFFETASSGTITLTTLYLRFAMMKTASILFFDEFDAFYHYELSENAIQFFKKYYPASQIILTTHNTNLLSNRLLRPDCLFILSERGKLTALCDATQRELREGHNLEKMYISGEFKRHE